MKEVNFKNFANDNDYQQEKKQQKKKDREMRNLRKGKRDRFID